MRMVYVDDKSRIYLGRAGENNVTKIVWKDKVSEWKEEFGDGLIGLFARRPLSDEVYPVEADITESDVVWTVGSADIAFAGSGFCELTYIVDDKIVKSQTWDTRVSSSLTDDDISDPPQPHESWVSEVLNAANDVKNFIVKAPYIGENGHWFTYDANKGKFTDSGVMGKAYEAGDGLKVSPDGNVISVDTANSVEENNAKPVTSAAVYEMVGNIEDFLKEV